MICTNATKNSKIIFFVLSIEIYHLFMLLYITRGNILVGAGNFHFSDAQKSKVGHEQNGFRLKRAAIHKKFKSHNNLFGNNDKFSIGDVSWIENKHIGLCGWSWHIGNKPSFRGDR